MAFRTLVSIDSFNFPNPSAKGYHAIVSTLVDSARNASGYFIGSTLRGGKSLAKVELKWNYLTTEDWSNILSQFEPDYGGAFVRNVTFFCETSGTWETRPMYVSDRDSDGWQCDEETGAITGWSNCSLSLIEV